jgi:hypothetical protein
MKLGIVAPDRRTPARLQGRAVALEGAIQNEPVSPKVRMRGARPSHRSLTRPTIPEQIIQRAVCEHLRQRGARGIVWWHTPNGGRRSRVEAAIFSGLGVRPGVSDIILLHSGQAYALELKSEQGRPTAAQMNFITEFRAAGGEGEIANGLDEALRTLETWGLLCGRAAFRCCPSSTSPVKEGQISTASK